MKQTITIDLEVRDGYELKYNPETKTIEEVKIEPIRSKSWEEFCKNHPKATGEYYIDSGGNLDYTIIRRPNNLATREDAEGILALIQLTRLHDEWVGDWKPEYGDFSSKKYRIVPDGMSIFVRVRYQEHNILDFPTQEMAKEFLDCFRDLIEKAKKFI